MNPRSWLKALAATALIAGAFQTLPAGEKRALPAFGALEAASADAVRARAEAWLKEIGKTDAQTIQRVQGIWAQDDRPTLDRLADTFALGNDPVARLLADAGDPLVPTPAGVPDLLKQGSAFFRSNLGLAYARALSLRHGHEEALVVLKTIRPEEVVAPATYLFTRAVCEHATLQREEATRTLVRLLEDGAGAPERYRTVAALMLLDIQTWKDKDLAAVARKMNVIGERLDGAKGGPQTQKLQKEVIFRLDELIKELENHGGSKVPGSGGPPSGGPPNGGPQPGGGDPNGPMPESNIVNNGGTGRVDPSRVKALFAQWGILTPREQARALQELTRGMSPRHREAIENYFRNIASAPR